MKSQRLFRPSSGQFVLALLVLSIAIACGTAAPEATTAPAASAPNTGAQASAPTATQPPPTVSAVKGQGAIGVPPTPVPTAVPTARPAMEEPAGEPAVTMMKVARGLSVRELNDPIAGRADLTFLLPMYEGLVQFDQFTDSQPMLATEWSTNDDFTVWSVKLRHGVKFHKGWGEMTAKDVVHSFGQERRQDHFDSRAGVWRDLIDRVEAPAGPDGDEVEFYLTKPEPIMTTYLTTNYTTVIRSKARWDDAGGALDANFEPNEAGLQVMQDDPIGTGPFQFAERAEAQYIRYEGLDYDHWRIKPDFPELQIFFVAEDSTRLAMLVTGEVHAGEIPRDLQSGAQTRGMEVLTSTTPAIRLVAFFGGNFLSDVPEYSPDIPLANAKVREAMNRAINREEINDTFLAGRGELMMQTHSHPKFPGWNPAWPDRFEEAYGYDPERAKQILAEAGYPNGFSMHQMAYPRAGIPELLDIAELINSYWKEIGIDVDFEPVEIATATQRRRGYNVVNTAWTHTGSFTEPTRAIYVYHYGPKSTFHGFDDEFFREKYEALEVASTPEDRDALMREMGDHCFDLYCTIPLFWVPYEFMVNPEVIAEWKTPGVFSLRDYEYIKAAH